MTPKKTVSKKPAPAAEKIAQARLLYDAGAPIAEILGLLDMSAWRFRTFREKHDWPMRPSACAPHGRAPERAAANESQKGAALRPEGLIARLEDAIESEFARVETTLVKQAPKNIEASARTLASLVKTLAELKRMRRDAQDRNEIEDGARDDNDGAGNANDDPPRELAELKAELARRLERLGGERPAE